LVDRGDFANGDIARAAGANPPDYGRRAFLRKIRNSGVGGEEAEADLN